GKRPADASPPRSREEFQPWQLFVLAALAAATAVVLLSRGSSPTNLIFISLAVLTTAVVGIAMYRTLLPLFAADVEGPAMIGDRTRAALEREKLLVLRAIKDLEFDRAMGKMSEDDFREMTGRLRARAARLIKALDAAGSGYQALIERELTARLAKEPAVAVPAPEKTAVSPTCAKCGTGNDADARFCKSCGAKLGTIA
ncbi:MAG: zinc ribbon domain-containing protein, partial [Acidobacteria bacterium]|nr:zinc ribbon domain-containing protein [Acidobacteriota bacterium]